MDRRGVSSGAEAWNSNWAQEIGADEYRIKTSQEILVTTKSVFNTAAECIQHGKALLVQHQAAIGT